jgi:hypothetical protein
MQYEVNNMNQEYYRSWIQFFEKDTTMKKELSDLMPDMRFVGNQEYALKVSDRMYDGVTDLKMMLLSAAGVFMTDEEKQYVNKWAYDAQTKIAEAGLDLNKLHKAYMDTIGNMRPEFVANVNRNAHGYVLDIQSRCPVSEAKTFNEMLHRMHIILERNENIHERFPRHDSSDIVTIFGGLTVFGDQTQLTKQLEASLALMFDTVNRSREAGPISIVSINENAALIMIRDMGHATTIKVEKEDNDRIYMNYYIPKVTNDDMVRQLPGFQSIAQTNGKSTYAVGEIATNTSRLGIDVLTLAYNIPTDSFMINRQYDDTTGLWTMRSDMPEEEHLFKTTEEILAKCVSTNCFQNFIDQNMEYATSEIGREAIIRGYEREYPGYIMQCIENGCYLPTGIVQSINDGEFPYILSAMEDHDIDVENGARALT